MLFVTDFGHCRGRSAFSSVAALALLMALPTLAAAATADERLAAALQALAEGDVGRAEIHVAAALAAEPDFDVAAALAADMRRRADGGSALLDRQAAPPDGIDPARWQRWRRELVQRSLPARVGQFPLGLYQVPATVTTVLIAETSRNQLHVVARSAVGWQVDATYYLSIGKRGVGKQAAGDRRTPLGLYWIVDRLEDHQLPPRYGPLAFPLDYPNAWDAGHARRGDGIWLHGTEPGTYARPPLDSDGCLVLADADLLALAERLNA